MSAAKGIKSSAFGFRAQRLAAELSASALRDTFAYENAFPLFCN